MKEIESDSACSVKWHMRYRFYEKGTKTDGMVVGFMKNIWIFMKQGQTVSVLH